MLAFRGSIANCKNIRLLWENRDWDPAGTTKYKSGGWQGSPKSNALWKSVKMPRGDPLIRLDPKMLIQFSCFWCFGPCVGEIFFDIKRFQSQL